MVSRGAGRVPLVAGLAGFGVAEILTGSTRPVVLLTSPVLFVLLVLLYACGVLCVRELTVRWGGGWATLLVLGAAYGVLEEGLVARSFFDPAWGDLGDLAGRGRVAGVNAIWAVYLTIFHATFTVAIPVCLAGLTIRDGRAVVGASAVSWLSYRWKLAVAIGLVVLTGVGVLVIDPGQGTWVHLAATALCVLGLAGFARVLAGPRWRIVPVGTAHPGRKRFAAWGFTGSLALFVAAWVLPGTGVPGAVVVAVLVALAVAGAIVALLLARHPPDAGQRAALILGALSWLGIVDVLLVGVRPDTTVVVLTGIVVAAALGVRRRMAEGKESG